MFSNHVQPIRSKNIFQYVTFEQPIVTPSDWIVITQQGYPAPTTLVVPSTGYYTIMYKMNICNDERSKTSALLTKNGIAIDGSLFTMTICESNVMSNTIIVSLITGDRISLLVGSNAMSRLGHTSFECKLPSGDSFIETTASIVFTKINYKLSP